MQIKRECTFTTVIVMSSSSAGYCMSTGTFSVGSSFQSINEKLHVLVQSIKTTMLQLPKTFQNESV